MPLVVVPISLFGPHHTLDCVTLQDHFSDLTFGSCDITRLHWLSHTLITCHHLSNTQLNALTYHTTNLGPRIHEQMAALEELAE